MRRTAFVVLGLCLAIPSLAEEKTSGGKLPEAVEILKKADAAAKEVHSVRYTIKTTAFGVASSFASVLEGETVMVGWSGTGPEKFFTRVRTKSRSGEPVDVTAGGDGEVYFLIDHTSKKAYEDIDPEVIGSNASAVAVANLQEFVHDAPFDEQMKGETIGFEGEESVDGEDCYKIRLEDYGGRVESTWYFSKKDYLPRKRVQHYDFPDRGKGRLEISVSDLELEPELAADLFKLKLPDGYEQSDDFAP